MRALTQEEAAVLRAVVAAGVPGDERLQGALMAQVGACLVIGPSCDCGCASLQLQVDRGACDPVPLTEFSADAGPAADLVGFRVLTKDGYLSDVEIFGYTGSAPSTWPAHGTVK